MECHTGGGGLLSGSPVPLLCCFELVRSIGAPLHCRRWQTSGRASTAAST